MLNLYKIPLLQIGVREDHSPAQRLQVGFLNFDLVLGGVSAIVFLLLGGMVYDYPPAFVAICLLWVVTHALGLLLNIRGKAEFSAVYLLLLYAICVPLLSILFGEVSHIHFILIICSFSSLTYHFHTKWVVAVTFIIFQLGFVSITLSNIPPFIPMSPDALGSISTGINLIFALCFSFKAISTILFWQDKIKEEVMLQEAERHARQSEERGDLLQLIIDNLPEYILWKDKDGRFQGANGKLAEAAGLQQAEDIKGKQEGEITLPNWIMESAPFRDETNSIIRDIVSHDSPSGEKHYYKVARMPLLNVAGEVLGTLYTYEDISKRKRVEEEKRESEERFLKLFEFSPFGISFRDLDSDRLVSMNPRLRRMFRIPDTVGSVKRTNYTHWEDLEHHDRMYDKLLAGEIDSFTVEKQYIRTDNSIFWGRISRTLIPINEKRYIAGMVEDIDERKRTELELIKSERRYRLLFENGFDGIVIFDTEKAVFKDVNQRLLNYFKMPSKEAFFQKNALHFSPEYQPNGKTSQEALDELILRSETESQYHFEWLHQLEDGTQLHTEIYTFRHRDNPHLFTSIYKDITENKRQEAIIKRNISELNRKNAELQKYIESNMQLENFAHIASHDLKSPMRTLVSFSQLLEYSLRGNITEDQKEYLGFIRKATRHMEELINDLLAYSKVDSSRREFQSLPLPELLGDILFDLQVSIKEKNISVTQSGIPTSITGDKTKVRQLFQNLLSNAIKFMREGILGKIHIACEEGDTHWHFSVKDNGIGIEPEYFNQIFLLFKKLHGNEEYEGTGIGLALCKKVVEQHGGNISVESVYGQGAKFIFSIKK